LLKLFLLLGIMVINKIPMKSTIFIFILMFLFSCNNKNEISKEFFLLKSSQDACNLSRNDILEKSMDFKYLVEDKSAGQDFNNRAYKIYSCNKEIVDSLESIINSIENLKEKILSDEGVYFEKGKKEERFQIQISERTHYWTNSNVDLGKDYQKEINSLKKRIFKFRAWVFHHICEYHNQATDFYRKFHFKDPKFKKGSLFKSKEAQFAKYFEHVAPDDMEAFKQIYFNITYQNIFIDEEVDFFMESQSLLKTLNNLTISESQLLNAGTFLVSLLRSNVGCADYPFDKIFINVDGPEVVKVGDSVQLRLFYSFYDSDQHPMVKINNLNPKSYSLRQKDGMSYLKIKADKNLELKGTLTILNKFGVPKTNEWSKKIEVLK
jgi:hypothetical protein